MAILVLVPIAADEDPDPEVVVDARWKPAGKVTINLNHINAGATITLTYNFRSQDADEADDGIDPDSKVRVDGDDAKANIKVSAFVIETSVPDAGGKCSNYCT